MRDVLEYAVSKNKYKKWVRSNYTYFNPDQSQIKERNILCDVFMVPEWLFVNVYGIQQLCKAYDTKAISFGDLPRRYAVDKIYNSVGVKEHLEVRLDNSSQVERHRNLFKLAVGTVRTKEELFNLTIDEVHIGIDIYESILRTGCPTVDMKSLVAWQNIFIGLEYFVYFEDLFSRSKIEALVLSHDNYIYMGIPSKIGFKFGVPSYLFNAAELLYLTRPYELHDRFGNFPHYFNLLNEDEKQTAKQWSEEQLSKRLNGHIGVEMSYQQKSAFTFEKIDTQILHNNKRNIVVATHEFYDNPHGYGGLLFLDFYEWLIFLGELSNETDYNWYLKPHRDVARGEIQQLESICKMYPRFILLKADYTFHQLKLEGVDIALTCYGTIGHELPLLGFIVINAGNNPHMAYNFNINPRTAEEYKNILLNLDTLSIDIEKEEIFEFFYTHKKIIYAMDFSLGKYLGNRENSGDIYADFMSIEPEFRGDLQQELEKFIKSKETYSFLLNYTKQEIN